MKRALVRVNGGIEKGQRGGVGQGSMGAWRRVRSDRGLALGQTGVVAVGQTEVWLWVRQEVVSSTLQGCKL